MPLARRAQEILHRQAAERAVQRAADERHRQAEADEYHRTHLDRERAAAFLEISTHRLKRLMAAGTAPACVKRGDTKQATVRWRLDELERWKANPAAYIAARNAAESAE